MDEEDDLQCEICGITENVSLWTYDTFDPLDDGWNEGNYLCGECGSKPYRAVSYFSGAIILIVLILGFIT